MKAKTSGKQFVEANPVEAFREIGQEIASEAKNESQAAITEMWKQIMGVEVSHASAKKGEMKEGQEINLSAKKSQEKPHTEAAPAINYTQEILHGESRITRKKDQAIEQEIQQILFELKRIVVASKEVELQFRELTVEQRITKAGEYHISFFQWMLAIVRETRTRVEDSAAWLGAFKGKKAKQGYWDMFQKHGTSFGMSNERNVATQAG